MNDKKIKVFDTLSLVFNAIIFAVYATIIGIIIGGYILLHANASSGGSVADGEENPFYAAAIGGFLLALIFLLFIYLVFLASFQSLSLFLHKRKAGYVISLICAIMFLRASGIIVLAGIETVIKDDNLVKSLMILFIELQFLAFSGANLFVQIYSHKLKKAKEKEIEQATIDA